VAHDGADFLDEHGVVLASGFRHCVLVVGLPFFLGLLRLDVGLVAGCALGGAFGVVFAVVGFRAAVFAAVVVAFGVKFAQDTGGLFADGAAVDFVVGYLEGRESVS
jgi:hypothetical protein